MSAVIMRNSSDPANPVDAPRKDDGSLYRYAMLFDGYKDIAFGDTLTDMTAVLLGHAYYDLTPEDQFAARIAYANSAQVWTQANINSDDRFDIESVTTEEYAVLMGSRDTQPHIETWVSAVPLVLLTTGYAPHTDVPAPVEADGATILWLDPETEESFLLSLASVDWINLAESGDHGDDA